MKFRLLALLGVVGFLAATLLVAEDKKDPLKDIKCPISGQPVKADKSAEYKDGKVYFCCGDCCGAFVKDSKKHATKANHQLVATGQAKQEKCPLSGGAVKDGTEVKIDGVEVKFCCNNCKGKASAAKEADQLELAFSDKAFEKGFKVPKKEKK